MGWLRSLTKDFILFCKLVKPSPSSLRLPSLRHHHRSCRPCHCPHPLPPPLLPSPLPSLLPLPLLTRQPCHRLHCLDALTLFAARHPHCHHSHRRRHRTRCCSPSTLVAIAIALAAPPSLPSQLPSLLPLLSLAHHPCCRHAASGGGGEDHTDPVRDPTSAATVGAAIIVAAFATRATGQEGTVQ
jgi:hypothetical protein